MGWRIESVLNVTEANHVEPQTLNSTEYLLERQEYELILARRTTYHGHTVRTVASVAHGRLDPHVERRDL